MFKHICVPVDNSDYSNRAIDLAVELGRACGARLRLGHEPLPLRRPRGHSDTGCRCS